MILFITGFRLLQEELGPSGFFGRRQPECIITDDSEAERGALNENLAKCEAVSLRVPCTSSCVAMALAYQAPSSIRSEKTFNTHSKKAGLLRVKGSL
jgi:hypothetical protein